MLNEDEENSEREIGSGKGNVERSSVEESIESWLVRGRFFVKRSAKMLEDIFMSRLQRVSNRRSSGILQKV